jgi:hypothetical protein
MRHERKRTGEAIKFLGKNNLKNQCIAGLRNYFLD